MDATAATTAQFTINGGLSTDPVHVWSSNIASAPLSDDFIHEQTIVPVNGVFTVTFQPGHVYSLSTTTGQTKGAAQPASSAAAQMPLPFIEDFESYTSGKLARYFSDINGGFETVPAGGGRTGTVYRQMVSQQPIAWNLAGAGTMGGTTMFGDPRWWGDYEASTDVLLEQSGHIELIGRIAAQAGQRISGYHLRVNSSGTWQLYSQDLGNIQETDVTIASGNLPFALNQWHNIALRMRSDSISVLVDGQLLASVTDTRHTTGNVALRVSGWQNAQFDNVQVIPTGAAPQFIPHSQMTVAATSDHPFFYLGDTYPVAYAIDDRPESIWHSKFNPREPLPQSITLDLGTGREVHALTYQPRLDNTPNGMITRYNVYLSSNGTNFTKVVADAQWPVSTATKVASWPGQTARYVRLEAVAGIQNLASAGEINVSTTAIGTFSAVPGAPDLLEVSDSGASSSDNITAHNNSSLATALRFEVSGTVAGATVTLYNGAAPIESQVVTGATTTFITNGASTWADGAKTITAKQTEIGKGESLASAPLSMIIDRTPPIAGLGASQPTPGAGAFDFIVTYADPNGVNATTFNGDDVMVTGPGGFGQKASFVSAAGNQVTYRITAPGGTWNLADNGTYSFLQNANQVSDNAGNNRPAGVFATFNVHLSFAWVFDNVLHVENGSATLTSIGGNVEVTRGTTLSFASASFSSILIEGAAGDDTIDFNGTIAQPVTFSGGGSGADTLNVNAGAISFAADAGAASSRVDLNVAASATALFNASQHLGALTVAGSATLAAGGNKSIVANDLVVWGRLDLMDNDLLWEYEGASPVRTWNGSGYTGAFGLVATGRNGGDWSGSGIVTSMPSAIAPNYLTTIAVADVSDVAGMSLFNGEGIAGPAVVFKYTYLGDASFDGTINGDDFAAIDAGYSASLTGYINGDFDLNGRINADDYFYIAANYSKSAPGI